MAATTLTPTCVWLATPELIVALDTRFGEPIDSYVNGSQVWLREDGPGDLTIEWRLHPVAGYQRPPGLATDEVFSTIALALGTGQTPPVPWSELWEGLEAFPAYGEEIEPAPLATSATSALRIPPDAAGLVDHRSIGDDWERRRGQISIIAAVMAQLGGPV